MSFQKDFYILRHNIEWLGKKKRKRRRSIEFWNIGVWNVKETDERGNF